MAMLPTMLAADRRRAGWSVARAAHELGVGIRAYREIEAGERSPTFDTWGPDLLALRLAADVRDAWLT